MDLGPMNVSIGVMNGGGTRTDSNAIAVTMPLLGMTARAAYVDSDASGASYDESGYQIGVAKSLGAATFGVQYDNAEIAAGDAGEVETWKLFYILYF
jgi:hypothetical protein